MTILQLTFLGKHNSTPIIFSYICFWIFFVLALEVQYWDQKEDLIQEDQEIMMVIKDRRQGNFETRKL
jgi:uncharacterized membrane protein affecting hemolysin expression